MELINVKELSSIEIFDKRKIIDKDGYDSYDSGCKLLGITFIKKGWYHRFSYSGYSHSLYIGKEKPAVHYSKPYCKIIMKNLSYSNKKFDTYEEAKQYAKQIRNKCSEHIKLIELWN